MVYVQAFAKNVGPCQPAQSAQADMNRNFSLSLYFATRQSVSLHWGSFSCLTKWILWIHDQGDAFQGIMDYEYPLNPLLPEHISFAFKF